MYDHDEDRDAWTEWHELAEHGETPDAWHDLAGYIADDLELVEVALSLGDDMIPQAGYGSWHDTPDPYFNREPSLN